MNLRFLALSVAAVLAITGPATAAGVRLIDVPSGPLRGIVWSPCDTVAAEISIRDSKFLGTKNCPVSPGKRPLIVMSHGRTGWSGGHHDTAAALADAGFIVAAIDHPIDSGRSKASRIEDIAYLTERPVDIKNLIDFMLDGSRFANGIDRERVGFFGFSRGGYTGLVLLGGRPNAELAEATCQGPFASGSLCAEVRQKSFPSQGFVHDMRIKAAVIADPAPIFFFGRDELRAVTRPIQLWASELGGKGASAQGTIDIGNALPSKTDVTVVQKAAHFAFMPACTSENRRRDREQCEDGPAFDRTAFHAEFNARVVAFFRQQLGFPPPRQ